MLKVIPYFLHATKFFVYEWSNPHRSSVTRGKILKGSSLCR